MTWQVVFPTSSVKHCLPLAFPIFKATFTEQFARIFFRSSRSPY